MTSIIFLTMSSFYINLIFYVLCRNHRVITDKEDIQERNWLNEGQVSRWTDESEPCATVPLKVH
jgi:hypothetical protein